MIRFLMIVFLLLLDVTLLCASDYTFSNGYYWRDGQAFTRSIVQSYDSRGCLINQYKYTLYTAPAPSVLHVTTETPNWRTELLKIAATRESNAAKLKQAALDQQEYLQAIKALGLDGGNGSNYTTTTSVDAYGYSQRSAPQGSTVFGYNEIADVYGNVDLGGLYQSAIRLAEASQRSGDNATNGAMQLVDQFGDRAQGLLSQQLAIAEINAKTTGVTNAARALGDAIKAEGRIRVEKKVEGPAPPVPGGSPILDEPSAKAANADDTFNKLTALVQTKCVSCHGGKTTEAGLSLVDLGKIDDDTVKKILERITTGNVEKRMPPGKPLAPAEIGLFFKAAN